MDNNGQRIEQVTSYSGLNNWGWEIRKRDQKKKNDNTDHIHQHENTNIVSRQKPEDQIRSNNMLHLAYSMEQGHGHLLFFPALMPLRCGYIVEYWT